DEPFFSQFNKLLAVTDLILLDIKHIDSQKHKELTMWPNESIIELAKYLSEINKPIWVRHVLIPERTDYDEFLIRLDAFLKTLKNIVKVEVLPYHKMGVYKWQTLGIPYQLEGIDPPTAERVENARKLLHTEDYKGYLDL
ncbi:MAG: pyruvate formate lyase 1-activating protein, partial [Trichococcus flocculiformis]